MVLLNRPFFHLSMSDNVIAFRCSSIIYPSLMLSPSYFQNSLSMFSVERVNGCFFGISEGAIFKSIENNNYSWIIYGNDDIARLVKT